MTPPAWIEITVFVLFALVAVAEAVGMATTMSMFRSAILLMASFIGVAGLFILLMADLLGMLQVMMYVGGMLVMALFMVLFSKDPGGERMSTLMSMPPLERFFSLGLRRPRRKAQGHGGDHGGMSMFTPQKRPAAILAAVTGGALVALVVATPGVWPVVEAIPDQRSARRVGHLLMSKYMIAFEGAGLLILLGIFGAVWISRPGRHPDPTDRRRIRAAVDEPPAPVEEEGR